jgi:putative copper resistance protein D
MVITTVAELGLVAWYLRRVQLLSVLRGRKWPVHRTAAFVGAVAMMALAWQTGIATYASSVFTVHIFQHLALMIAAPVLFALSAPVTLVMQTSSRPAKVKVLRLLRSRPMHMATNPLLTFLANYGLMFWFFLDHGIVVSMAHAPLMDTANTAFLVFGCLMWWPITSPDFIGRRPYSPPIRALMGVVGMPFDSVLAVSLMTGGTTVSIAPTMYSAANVATGAEVFWILSMVLTTAGVLVPARRWLNGEQRASAKANIRLAEAGTARAVSTRGWWDAETALGADGLLSVPWADASERPVGRADVPEGEPAGP